MKRNITDFNRGSQLLAHFSQMFAAGFKLPLFAGIVLYSWITWYAIQAELSDNQVSLIIMKVYAEFWRFMEFDPAKAVTLSSAYGGSFQLAMARVPAFPPVVRAWDEFIGVLVYSVWLTAAILIPATVVFFWCAAWFGKHSKARKHQRGRWLATTRQLIAEVRQYNRQQRSAELRAALGWGWWLTSRKELAAAGLWHRPFTLAGVPWPWREEQTHAMLIGSTGTGKTVAMMDLLDQIRTRGHRSVVFDLTGAYVSTYYDPARDTILHPLDVRCPCWSIFDECRNPAEFMGAAEALVPSDGGGEGQFWVQGARMLFTSMCISLVEQDLATNENLAHKLMTADLETVYEFVKDTPAAPMSSPDSPRLADSVRAVFNANAQALLYLPKEGTRFSIRDWIEEDKKDGAILFISSRYVDLPVCRQLLTLWLNSAVNTLMRGATRRDLRMWFLIDELGALHRLPALEQGMQTARNYGGAFVTGVHTQAKLKETYGPHATSMLSSLAKTKLILGNPDPETAGWCSEIIGNAEVQDMNEGYSFNYSNSRDSVNLNPERRELRIVLTEEVADLNPLHGYLCLPGSMPPAPVTLVPKARPKLAQGYIQRGDFDLVPGSKRKTKANAGRGAGDEDEDADETDDGESGRVAEPRSSAASSGRERKPEPRMRQPRRTQEPDQNRTASEQSVQQSGGQAMVPSDPKSPPSSGPVEGPAQGALPLEQPERIGDVAPPNAGGPEPKEAGKPEARADTARRAAARHAALNRDSDGPGNSERDRSPDLGDFGPS